MPNIIFVTGTDTGIGKTTISVALLHSLNQQGFTTIGLKPIAAGSLFLNEKYWNEDALALQEAASIPLPYSAVNPFTLHEPLAPHIAAARQSTTLNVSDLVRHCRQTMASYPSNYVIIEGAGGWLVPLNDHETMADLAKALNASVILIVGMRLGCLNHSLLTYQAIQQAGVAMTGWIANKIDPTMQAIAENIVTLKQWIKAPCLGEIPFITDIDHFCESGMTGINLK